MSEKRNIYNIVDDVKEFNELYILATDEDEREEAFYDTLEALKDELTEKAYGYAAVMNRLEMEEKDADEKAKITIEPDKDKIRKYLADNECDFAHLGERGKHIEVK